MALRGPAFHLLSGNRKWEREKESQLSERLPHVLMLPIHEQVARTSAFLVAVFLFSSHPFLFGSAAADVILIALFLTRISSL